MPIARRHGVIILSELIRQHGSRVPLRGSRALFAASSSDGSSPFSTAPDAENARSVESVTASPQYDRSRHVSGALGHWSGDTQRSSYTQVAPGFLERGEISSAPENALTRGEQGEGPSSDGEESSQIC